MRLLAAREGSFSFWPRWLPPVGLPVHSQRKSVVEDFAGLHLGRGARSFHNRLRQNHGGAHDRSAIDLSRFPLGHDRSRLSMCIHSRCHVEDMTALEPERRHLPIHEVGFDGRSDLGVRDDAILAQLPDGLGRFARHSLLDLLVGWVDTLQLGQCE